MRHGAYRTRAAGFTLVEVLIVIAILAILLSLGLPAFNTYTTNMRLRAAAEVFLGGLDAAKVQAATRNQNVELLLTDTPAASAVNTATANTTGTAAGWMVRSIDTVLDGSGTPTRLYFDGRSADEGGKGVGNGIVINGAEGGAALGGITFTPLGRTNNIATRADFNFTAPDSGNCAAAGGKIRCLRVIVTATGRTKLCDPAVSPTATPPDTRACPSP